MVSAKAVFLERANKRLDEVLRAARALPSVRRLGPSEVPASSWQVEFQGVGRVIMRRLNAQYRSKDSVTDVLSFPSPPIFYRGGHLGELVLCLPVLRKQAAERGHSEAVELDVLLTHGLLHLLGLDHEHGVQEAQEMRKLEEKVLCRLGHKAASALITRAGSGKS